MGLLELFLVLNTAILALVLRIGIIEEKANKARFERQERINEANDRIIRRQSETIQAVLDICIEQQLKLDQEQSK